MKEENEHSEDCGCPPLIYVRAWQEEKLAAVGWYSHYVPLPDTGTINAHTHGFDVLHGQPDVQIVCPVPMEVASSIFWNIHHLMEAGVVLQEGQLYLNVIQNMAVKFIKAEECERAVMRCILPDKNGELDEDKMESPFDWQYALD